jgi:thioredoxin reductase
MYDVLIVGGGPAGLSAALSLGRARKRVLLCDTGLPRNEGAARMHNFVTHDGTPPEEFRRIGRSQLAIYTTVEIRDVGVAAIEGTRNAFTVRLDGGDELRARRILLATGLVDEMLPIDGFRELWGHAIFQCPYCHGWEVKDERWGLLIRPTPQNVAFAMMARGFTTHRLTVFSDLPEEARALLRAADIHVVGTPVRRFVAQGRKLTGVELADGTEVPCEVLFAAPPQHQVALVESLGLAVQGVYLKLDPTTLETSRRGIYASGDLMSPMQTAIAAAASGMLAATMINFDLSADLRRPDHRTDR